MAMDGGSEGESAIAVGDRTQLASTRPEIRTSLRKPGGPPERGGTTARSEKDWARNKRARRTEKCPIERGTRAMRIELEKLIYRASERRSTRKVGALAASCPTAAAVVRTGSKVCGHFSQIIGREG